MSSLIPARSTAKAGRYSKQKVFSLVAGDKGSRGGKRGRRGRGGRRGGRNGAVQESPETSSKGGAEEVSPSDSKPQPAQRSSKRTRREGGVSEDAPGDGPAETSPRAQGPTTPSDVTPSLANLAPSDDTAGNTEMDTSAPVPKRGRGGRKNAARARGRRAKRGGRSTRQQPPSELDSGSECETPIIALDTPDKPEPNEAIAMGTMEEESESPEIRVPRRKIKSADGANGESHDTCSKSHDPSRTPLALGDDESIATPPQPTVASKRRGRGAKGRGSRGKARGGRKLQTPDRSPAVNPEGKGDGVEVSR